MENIGGHGYIRVAAAAPAVELGNCGKNAERIIAVVNEAASNDAAIVVFPELSVTGYTCGDLFHQKRLLDAAEKSVAEIAASTSGMKTAVIVGAPVKYCDRLFNCAIVIFNGKIAGIVPKSNIPNYGEFYEKRWFSAGLSANKRIFYAGNEGIPFGTGFLSVWTRPR